MIRATTIPVGKPRSGSRTPLSVVGAVVGGGGKEGGGGKKKGGGNVRFYRVVVGRVSILMFGFWVELGEGRGGGGWERGGF